MPDVEDEAPMMRSFLVVVVLSAITFGIYGFYHLYRALNAADARRDTPFMAKTYWTLVGLTIAMVASVLLIGLPGMESEVTSWPALQPSPDGAPVFVADGPQIDDRWATNASEFLIVAAYLCGAAFLFMELVRFRPPVASPLALPVVLLVQLPFLFLPGLTWVVLVLDALALFGFYDLHRGLLAFFDEAQEPPAPAAPADAVA